MNNPNQITMESKFKSLSVFEFQSKFPDIQSCSKYLAELKWKDGYKCPICSNLKYCKGIKDFDRQCTKCCHLESPTAGTLFHKVKFSLQKAFWIVYFISTNKKGMASTELSRKLQLRQKTCWLFKQKVMQAMESSNIHPLQGQVELGLFDVGYLNNTSGSKKNERNKIILAIEKKSKGISRMYGCHLKNIKQNVLLNFVKNKVDQEANVTSYDDLLNHKIGIKKTKSNIIKFNKINRATNGLKSWFAGIHGNVKYIQYYINEYCYRYNRHLMKGEIFDDLLTRMVKHEPRPYFDIVNYAPTS